MSALLIARVRALATTLGRSPTQKELREGGIWSTGAGGYQLVSELLDAAGLTPRPEHGGRPPEQRAQDRADRRERMLERVRALAAELGRTPTKLELRTHKIWRVRDGGYMNLSQVMTDAGLEVRPHGMHLPKDQRPRRAGVVEMNVEGEQRAARRLRYHNVDHPHRRRIDSDLPPWGWMP